MWHRISSGIGIAPGVYPIRLYRREANLEVDRILITTDSNFTPSGIGPIESPRAAPGEQLPPPVNQPPVINGTPAATATVDQPYLFVASAYDPEGGAVSFGIEGRPAWASFNSATGRLEGIPGIGDIGLYTDIRITVTDGQNLAELSAFNIEVLASASGSLTVTWNPPLTNTDGSTLTDLAGYKVYRGTQSGQYSQVVEIGNPGVTSYTLDQLPTGVTHFVVITSMDESGNESAPSEEVVAAL